MRDSTPFRPEDEAAGILAAIVDSSDDAIIGKDLNGRILTWNRGAERLYGYSKAEAIGQSVSVLIPPDQADELPGILARIRAGGHVEHYDTIRRTRDGRLVTVSLSVSPIRDGEGRVVGASAIARDITARKQTELALRINEERWRSIVGAAVDGVIVIDARGLIEAFNPAAERLFGWSEAEVVGRNVSVLMPAPYREEHDGYLARYLTTGVQQIIGQGREVTGLRRDGTTFPLHLSVGEMTVGGERKFTGILHDLSARVRMEEQLREQAALARVGEMAAVIAHEVRNPLAGIRGAIQVIGSRLAPGSKEVAVTKEIIGRIDALNTLMQDLLLFARPPQPHPTSVEVVHLVSSTAELLNQDPALRDVQVDIEGSAPPVLADPDLLKIVFLNLMVNGAHAMGGRGRLRVSVASRAAQCHIAFADSGAGIPPDIREKIFTPFFTTKARGTGLGLPTAKRIVEAHRGVIRVDCPAAGGTVVTIQLPS